MLEGLGNLGDFVGGIGVVVTLLYLATQIRQNTKATRAGTFLDLTNAWQDYLFASMDPRLAELTAKAGKNPEDLTSIEYFQLYSAARVLFRRSENDYFQFRSGTFDPGTWAGYRNSLVIDVLSSPAYRAMWAQQKAFFAPEYATFIDEQLERARARPAVDLDRALGQWLVHLREESRR